jgi:threonine dehydrogenase-like Zn-dependent dehydrogenase
VPIDLIVLKAVSIFGSLGMQAPRYTTMLKMFEAGRLNPCSMLQRRIGLEDASSVIESMDKYWTFGVTVIDRY